MASDWTNGASLRNEQYGGRLYITDSQPVEHLNADMLDGAHRANLLEQGSDFGITQTGKTLSMAGEIVSLDAASQIKIGNVVIKSSDNGNGILFGLE